MISSYKENKKKYEKVLQYIGQNANLSEELKQEISEVAEKYRICIYTMEKEEIMEKIERCGEKQDVFPLKRYLQQSISGYVRDTEVYEWEDEIEYETIY